MSNTAQLLFRSDGKCLCLYTEVIDLAEIGRLNVTRQLNVVFDNDKQAWRVKDKTGF